MPRYYSPAKVNLFLRVLSRRSDGYHEIASLFQAIDLFDHLDIDLAEHDQFTCSDHRLPTDGSNLVLKAVAIFRQKTSLQAPVRIHLAKHIPAEAGLGGGSGNAATTLWALNELLGMPATLEQLKAWSAEIGSDIPFFFSQGTAYCAGRGEIVQELKPMPSQSLIIVKPPYGLSTPSVYKALDISNVSRMTPEDLLKSFEKGQSHYVNDLEAPAFALKPELFALKKELCEQYEHVLLAGSGTSLCCFGNEKITYKQDSFFSKSARFVTRSQDRWYAFG